MEDTTLKTRYIQGGKASTKPAGTDIPYIFKHAPPTADDDPWDILLKPELEADTARCNAWKDEVQNLLIFAGLFSAVVTAFVVESYKFLQPDPNSAVVGLLFVIANSLNATSPLPPSVDPASIATPFSQPSSSIRINIFWFLSLILSLTTVLIGTISLQWLREHQSYSGFSAKEKLAILHMRLEALDVWCVPQIFSALPLLLQGALTLFLAGLIDFVLLLGPKLTIPVCIIIGLTLLFLSATTILPTFQGFLFLTGFYPYRKPPALCAYKSPQSHVFLALFALPIRILSVIATVLYEIQSFFYSSTSTFRRYAALTYLRKALRQNTWSNLDRRWLDLRDAYHQCILDKDPWLNYAQRIWSDSFPLSDITRRLVEIAKENPTAKHTEAFLGAVVRCFQEISASVWIYPQTEDYTTQRQDRRNNYFEQLYQQPFVSVTNSLLYGGVYNYDQIDSRDLQRYLRPPLIPYLFYRDQIFSFLVLLHHNHHSSPKLSQYTLELWLWITSNAAKVKPLSSQSSNSPGSMGLFHADTASAICSNSALDQRYTAVADMLAAIFKLAASHHISQDHTLDSFCAYPGILEALQKLTFLTYRYLLWANEFTFDTFGQKHQQDIDAQFGSLFEFIAKRLKEEMSNSQQNPKEDIPSVFFYLASWFLHNFLKRYLSYQRHYPPQQSLHNTDSFLQGLGSFFDALLEYRAWTQISNRKNDTLETHFKKDFSWEREDHIDRFSDDWWDNLFKQGRELGLNAAEATGVFPNPPLNTLSQGASMQESMAENITTLCTTYTSSAVVDRLLASDELAPDADINVHDDQDDIGIQQTMSNSLSVTNPTTTTNKSPDSTDTPTLLPLQLSLSDPHTICISDDDPAAIDAEIQAPSPSQPLPSCGMVGASPQPEAASDAGDEQTRIQHGEPHLMIEIGSPIVTEQNESVGIPGSDNEALQDQPVPEDVVAHTSFAD